MPDKETLADNPFDPATPDPQPAQEGDELLMGYDQGKTSTMGGDPAKTTSNRTDLSPIAVPDAGHVW